MGGREHFSEATVGHTDGNDAAGAVWKQLFHTDYFHVNAVPDVVGCELCGTLKNIVALGAGFVDGLELGNNTKAAIMRVGLVGGNRARVAGRTEIARSFASPRSSSRITSARH